MAAANDRRIEKVTVGRVVYHVAENSALRRLFKDRVIYVCRRGSGDREKKAIQIFCGKRFLTPCDGTAICQLDNSGGGLRRDHADLRAADHQTLNFLLGDAARSDHQAGTAGKLHE